MDERSKILEAEDLSLIKLRHFATTQTLSERGDYNMDRTVIDNRAKRDVNGSVCMAWAVD